MDSIREQNKCRHSSCRCSLLMDEGDYCSDHCRTASQSGSGAECGCEHPECDNLEA